MKIGFISDSHGNLASMKRCIINLKEKGAKKIYFLGDSVGYIPSCGAIEFLNRNRGIECILGNHEAMLLNGVFNESKDKVYQLKTIENLISNESLDYIKTWPKSIELVTHVGKLLLVHGSPIDFTNGYVYPDTDLKVFADSGYEFIFMGHTHRPFIRYEGNTCFVNIGSSGLPRDYGNLASCALLDSVTSSIEILQVDIEDINIYNSKNYDIHTSVKKIFNRRA